MSTSITVSYILLKVFIKPCNLQNLIDYFCVFDSDVYGLTGDMPANEQDIVLEVEIFRNTSANDKDVAPMLIHQKNVILR